MWYDKIDTPEELERVIRYVERRAEESLEEIEKLAMRCIQKAQQFKDIDLEFKARLEYINVVNYRHKADLMIAMFPWLLKKCDEDRSRFPYDEVLWAYRWVISSVKQFASVSMEKLDELWADYEQRMRDAGAGERMIHFDKFGHYEETGRIDLADAELKLYMDAPYVAKFAHCRRCAPTCIADHYLILGKYKEMLEITNPVLKGEVTCHQVQRYTYHMGMMASMMLGEWENAEYYAIKSRKSMDMNMSMLFAASSHLFYYGVKGEFAKGRNIFEKQFPFTFHTADLQQFEFFTGALFFFTKLKESGRKTVKLTLAKNDLIYNESSVYTTDEMVAALDGLVQKKAGALDKRNGNGHYTQYAETIMKRYGSVVFGT